MQKFISKIETKQDLSLEESVEAFRLLMEGKANDEEIFNFLTKLSFKGEAANEIAGGVYILREKAKRVYIDDCVDTCGTGGDGLNTLNISTAAAILLASMGVKVAKHGNKAVSSKCGSGDVLEALKVNINLEPNEIINQINKNNFGFMFAPNYHSAMKFVGPTRKKIGKRTIFNMIGPLSSPASVKRQVVGVFDKKLLKIFAEALKNLDIKFAWIVNSEDGLDEISPYAKTSVVQLKNKEISEFVIDPIKLLRNLKSKMSNDAILRIEVPNDFSSFQSLLTNLNCTEKTWISPPEHLSYFNANSLKALLANQGFVLLSLQADFPIEQFLINKHSNYFKNRDFGRDAHLTRVKVSNYLADKNLDRMIDYQEAAADLEFGRQLTAYVKIASK